MIVKASARPARWVTVTSAGTATGVFGAYCYHSGPLLRPIAHSVGVWVFLALLCAALVDARPAVGYAVLSLAGSVLGFYAARDLVFGHYSLSADDLALWGVAAALGGTVIGLAAANLRQRGWCGPLACALVSGLLLGDALKRLTTFSGIDLAEGLSVLFALAVPALGNRDKESLWRFAVLVIPAAVIGWALVSVPDMAQQYLVTR